MNIIDELTWRDAVNQQTNEERLRELVDEKSISLYCGVDPTGDSMHIGHLIPFMMMKRFQLAGHHPYILIGGGTGTIETQVVVRQNVSYKQWNKSNIMSMLYLTK